MDLSLLGLNLYETNAYKALILLGEATAAQTSKESEVPYGRIYDVLAALEQKGFVKKHVLKKEDIPKTRRQKPADFFIYVTLGEDLRRIDKESFMEILHPELNQFIKESVLGVEGHQQKLV